MLNPSSIPVTRRYTSLHNIDKIIVKQQIYTIICQENMTFYVKILERKIFLLDRLTKPTEIRGKFEITTLSVPVPRLLVAEC